MASKVSGEGDGQDTARFEIIQISPGKIKYMNPKFSKIQAKVWFKVFCSEKFIRQFFVTVFVNINVLNNEYNELFLS